jgi:hypothetical protein
MQVLQTNPSRPFLFISFFNMKAKFGKILGSENVFKKYKKNHCIFVTLWRLNLPNTTVFFILKYCSCSEKTNTLATTC